MPEENLELAHRVFDAFNRRDLDAFLAFMDPDVDFNALVMELEGHPLLRGHSGVREWWRRIHEVFPDYRAEILEMRDFGDSALLAIRMHGHGLESGIPVDAPLWQAVRIRDGKITWWRLSSTEEKALEALGLSE